MANAGKLRIAMEGARELEVDVDDIDAAVTALESGVEDESIVWLTDSKGDRHGIVGGRLAVCEPNDRFVLDACLDGGNRCIDIIDIELELPSAFHCDSQFPGIGHVCSRRSAERIVAIS